ncbi:MULTISPECIES: hypothetical protein [Agrobacterium]|uniref:Uncharacterized protein n=2 Tax=Agrobacterium tumefaciens complex TaxID=1183400 RepID=A0AAE6BIF3_AGRTU|nr:MULTISPECIES: hypothetical protein [Agrobacterium]ASK40631.1 hypothetical protein [Agrobacterium genomosp. 6]ASK41395.1 hypothetical protein [Agrobacterium genomosp. 6]QCL77558.1 hypothetical protein CFBP5499_29390 [Agrobacterium tumefaciens]QCL83047.1 hypothetical protein CFBP5877_28560 [Agrobacterium tumefaciens]CUX71398.1 conserved hypothetical protein [Agrobacterium sp. NCPPB 925]
MRYWEACEAQVTAEEAIEECRIHEIDAVVRQLDDALINLQTGDVIAYVDEAGEYSGADILGYLGY